MVARAGRAHSNLPVRMDTIREIAELTAHRGRAAGSDAERRAAVHLRRRLQGLGRDASLQAIEVRPRFGLAHALHAVVAIAGSVVAVENPAPGAALVLLALVAMTLDLTGTLALTRRLTPRRASQNVESREDAGKPGTLVIVAHCDAARASGGWALATRVLREPWRAMALAMVALLAACALRLLGIEGTGLTAAQFLPTVLLILVTPALIDVELSPPGPALPDAGAAVTALRLADGLGGTLEHFDLWVVITGAQRPSALGMAAWMRANRRRLDRERTAVICLDSVGSEEVRYTVREGALTTRRSHRQLVTLCAQIAEDDGADGTYGARTRVEHERTAATVALARRMPAITIGCAGASVSPEGLDRAHGFVTELIERLDAEVGPQLAADAGAREEAEAGEAEERQASEEAVRPA